MDELDITISALKVCGNSDASFCSTGGEWVVVVMKHLSQLSMQVKNQSLVRPVRRSRAALGGPAEPRRRIQAAPNLRRVAWGSAPWRLLVSADVVHHAGCPSPAAYPGKAPVSGTGSTAPCGTIHPQPPAAPLDVTPAAGVSPSSMEAASPAAEIGNPSPD
jgi:hypothetical protein